MKQHITKEQWDELSDEQKDKAGFKTILSIGQMIEFLGDFWLSWLHPEGYEIGKETRT